MRVTMLVTTDDDQRSTKELLRAAADELVGGPSAEGLVKLDWKGIPASTPLTVHDNSVVMKLAIGEDADGEA